MITETAMCHVSEFSHTPGSVDFDEGAGQGQSGNS